jgi:cysteinyl-tRNA synthetase
MRDTRSLVYALSVLALSSALVAGCSDDGAAPDGSSRDYREDMRAFVQGISAWAKGCRAGFMVIPQNGQELMTLDGEPDGPTQEAYLAAIDGVGREDLFYGYDDDDVPTPADAREWMIGFLDVAEDNGVEVLVTDYCTTPAFVDDSYDLNAQRGYVSLAAERALDSVPSYPPAPFNINTDEIATLSDASNFLYLLDPSSFQSREAYLDALRSTAYDILLIDAFCEGISLTAGEVSSLRTKANGGSRLVVAYMSIGEAEDYRFYWQPDWSDEPPAWLAEENPDWPGNYKVRYWDPEWQSIIYGTGDSYLGRILSAGFDGVYLDIIDAFEYFEE